MPSKVEMPPLTVLSGDPGDDYLMKWVEWAIHCWPERRQRELTKAGTAAKAELAQLWIDSTRELAPQMISQYRGNVDRGWMMAIRVVMLELDPD